jgi:aminoglycoside 3-N-acetyltransferase
MKALLSLLENRIDKFALMRNTEKLWREELGQTFRHYHAAAECARELMAEAGLSNIETLRHPADGRTTFLDFRMPLGWDVTRAALSVTDRKRWSHDPVVADYTRHPFHIIKGSTSTPPEGIRARLVTEKQLFSGYDVTGALVIADPTTRLRRGAILSPALDRGALGVVTDCITDRYLTPDGVAWVNGCTEGNHWHVQADDRDFIGFSVSPRTGDRLRAACRDEPLPVQVVCDGRRYEDELEIVTGVVPGKEPREVWVFSHLYEPLADDNSSGVAGSIEMARVINELVAAGKIPPPTFTLRLVFAMEVYGFAAYAQRRGIAKLRNEVVGLLNTDNCANALRRPVISLAPAGAPSCGDFVMQELAETTAEKYRAVVDEQGMYADDTFLNDATVGVPSIWIVGKWPEKLWHNSSQDMGIIDPELFAGSVAFHAAWLAEMLTLDEAKAEKWAQRAGAFSLRRLLEETKAISTAEDLQKLDYRLEREQARIADFRRLHPALELKQVLNELDAECHRLTKKCNPVAAQAGTPSRYRTWLENIVPSRNGCGVPYDYVNAPLSERKKLPDGIMNMYGAFASILSRMDGKRTLAELLDHAAWVQSSRSEEKPGVAKPVPGIGFDDKEIRKIIGAITQLNRHGYLRTDYGEEITITRKKTVRALREAGLKEGDMALVHGGLSHFGNLEGGAEMVIDAFLEVIGESGTLFLPTFTCSFAYSNGVAYTRPGYRPFHKDKTDAWVGELPNVFRRRPGVIRSSHPTHSVAGFGPLAEACLREHKETSGLTDKTSVFQKMVEHGGKMVWFGADLATTTFFHFLEDATEMPYLAPCACRVERENGKLETVIVPGFCGGHRDFYKTPGEESKAYRHLLANGLNLTKTKLGFGEIKLIEARQMYELGVPMARNNRRIFLCDDPACDFCSKLSPDD